MIEAGTYKATLLNHGISLKKDGEPQVIVNFEIKDVGHISYYGYFSDKARPYTIANLIKLGLKGDNPAGELEVGKEVELVVTTETYKGKERSQIKYINTLEGRKTVEMISNDMAKAKLAAFEGAVAAERLKLNAKEDLPF